MIKYDYYWASDDNWYHFNENGIMEINNNAPKEAQESYKHYLEQKKRFESNDTNGRMASRGRGPVIPRRKCAGRSDEVI